ncbi:ThiF family adenylyltransferase [Mesorhizobium sp. M0968]|uniref:ThiF family adenylyltransferase n=1 Tax=Mesorhizobium sp. M0968 TaxID=2957037 RepID=UPI00333D358C
MVDDDKVDRSNLQRQILHTDARVGRLKVQSAKEALSALNPTTTVRTHNVRLTKNHVEEIFPEYQVVVDGSDNFNTHYLVHDACIKLGLPAVHAAVFRFEGQMTVSWPAGQRALPSPC